MSMLPGLLLAALGVIPTLCAQAVADYGDVMAAGGEGFGQAPQRLVRLETRVLPVDTHRPEVLPLPDGGVLIVVVQPDNNQQPNRVKHRAYRYDRDWNLTTQPFPVTRVTAEFGEPADHRAALVNGELVVFYQCVVLNGNVPPGAPAESFASEQSLLMARFSLDGEERSRVPVMAHVTDFREDNFPDFCILWSADRFLVSTGSLSPILKIREVTLDGEITATHELRSAPDGIGGSIGNSLHAQDGRLLLLSSTGPLTGDLTVTPIDEDWRPAATLRFTDPAREQSFPVGTTAVEGLLLTGYIARARGGPNALLANPYSPWIKVWNADLEILQDEPLGEGGFAHVHPTVALSGDRVLMAWSKAVARGPGQVPQVQLEILAFR